MLNFSELVLRRGSRKLIDQLSWTVHAGQKVGIVGRNGSGKSSLFAMLQGELAPDAGSLSLPQGLSVAHVRQETPALETCALDYVLAGDEPWCALDAALQDAEARSDAQAQASLHERMHAIDGYTAKARAARLLDGLGFMPSDAARAVKSFSGGWRMRLNLAQALMCRSDLLLLDEPTNHLDLDAVLWLQTYLHRYPGTLLLISHDRDFLDAVITQILYIDQGKATLYSGNYSACERQRAERLAQQAASYAAQQQRAEQLQRFVDRFRAKATKARQAQSRLKQLEKMTLEAPAHWQAPFRFEFAEPEKLPRPLLKLNKVEVGYAGHTVLRQVVMDLQPGDRIALLGRNGAGKSTLIRTLAGMQAPLQGELMRDAALRTAYFAQHQIDTLDPQASPMLHLQRMNEQAREQELRDFLGGFDFSGDRVFEPVEPFSGGEKARLALALLVYQQPNLLLLDEPTNHLDLDMRHALELALQEFSGAMVLVSHDRHLISSCTDQLWLVEDGACQPFAGDLDDYAELLRRKRGEDNETPAAASAERRVSAKDVRRQAAAQRQREKPLRDELRKLEAQTQTLEKKIGQLETALADPALYQDDAARASELVQEQGLARKALEVAEARWLEVLEQLEQTAEDS